MRRGHLNPARLPLGTRVGPWRVVDRRGRGAYGAVYRAVGAKGESGLVALKLALHPRDERFAREVELLSRIRHPSIPRLVGHGEWQPSPGLPHPYLAMEFIEGMSLYDWAREHVPTSRQVLWVLARLARALEATHAVGGVHRDVKGDNVLIRAADGHVFLTDFGSGHYVGAARLTWNTFPPGTPAYRSPEAWRAVQPEPYAPRPADDVFALGVTAWRLVTNEYPPATNPAEEPSPIWSVEGPGPRPPRALNVRCCAELSDLVSRMLAVCPEARGSARELAESLEQAMREVGPEADVPLFVREEPLPTPPRIESRRVVHRPPVGSWFAAASVGAALTLGAGWLLRVQLGEEPAKEQVAMRVEAKDGGAVAVGDSALSTPVSPTQTPSARPAVAMDMPPGPLPGQRRPDANGRCAGKMQVPINGGCWYKLVADPKDCDPDAYVHKGACYAPAFPPGRPATSGPANRPGSQ